MTVRTDMRGDRGAVAVFVALVAVLLFAFGAFAVDLGAAYAERRADQTSADAAALAGANALPDMLPGGSKDAAIRDAVAFVEANLAAPPEGWTAAWAGCDDAGHLAYVTSPPGTCVSVSSYGTRVRVVVPVREVPTTLAGVLGIDSIPVSAFAVAQLEYSFSADVLPFGIPPSASASTETCLKSSTNGHSQQAAELTTPCDGSDQGNFGTMDFTHFGSAALGTLEQCTGQTQDRLTRNIILGVDHALSTLAGGTPLTDLAACSAGADHGSRPNGAATQTGGPDLQQALVSGVADDKLVSRDLPGRLAQAVAVPGWPTDQVQSQMPALDNQPLWSLIDPAAAAASGLAACDPAVIAAATPPVGGSDPGAARRDAMRACLAAATASAQPLFGVDSDGDGVPDLAESNRFAYVPVVDQEFDRDATGHITGTKTVHFLGFVPVYLESVVWTSCQGNDYVFRPDPADNLVRDGSPYTGTVSKTCKADALTAFILPTATLPAWIVENGPGTRGTPTVVLYR